MHAIGKSFKALFGKHGENGLFTLRAREGVTIAECIILVVVVSVALGGLFTTMTWANNTYTFSKQDMGARGLLFSWVQGFESRWKDPMNVDDTAKDVTQSMGGTWNSGKGTIGTLTLTASEVARGNGRMKLRIAIFGGQSRKDNKDGKILDLERSFNLYSNDTVSDDKGTPPTP
jgi:hypothetical protein